MSRVPCLVPGCRRTTSVARFRKIVGDSSDDGWICAAHWALLPKQHKAVKRRVLKHCQINGIAHYSSPTFEQDFQRVNAAQQRFLRISMWCTRFIIERATGIR